MAIKTTWAAGDVLTATDISDTLASKSSYATPTNAQTGTTYTFVLLDAGKTVTASNASASSYNIPLEATVAWGANTELRLYNIGAGTVTVSCTSGTLAGTVTIPQYGFVTLKKAGTNTWYGIAQDKAVPSGGMVLVSETAFTAVSSVSVNNCFSSAYDSYLILAPSFTASTLLDLSIRLRVSGTDNSASSYNRYGFIAATGSLAGNAVTGSTALLVNQANSTNPNSISVNLNMPAAAAYTRFTTQSFTTGNTYYWGCDHQVATAFDGFTLIASAGTITGTVRVYGLRNSI